MQTRPLGSLYENLCRETIRKKNRNVAGNNREFPKSRLRKTSRFFLRFSCRLRLKIFLMSDAYCSNISLEESFKMTLCI